MTKRQGLNPEVMLRLHQSSPIFLFIDTLKEFFLIIVLAIFASRTETWQLWAIGFATLLVLPRVLSVRFFKYWILPDELVVKSGILFRQERHIPYTRVQNISQTQGILHRLFGVCKVELESASGTKPEAVFNVISLAALEAIRKASQGKGRVHLQALDNSEEESQGHEVSRPLVFLSVPELIKHGLLSRQGLIPVAILFGYFSQQDRLLYGYLWPWVNEHLPFLSALSTASFSVSPLLVLASILSLVLLGLMIFWLLSITVSLFRFYKFTLIQSNEKLTSEMGLLTRRSASASQKRIQKITIVEGILHRIFQRASVSCKTAGNSRDSNNLSKSFHYLAPILPASQVQILLKKIQGEVDWTFLNASCTEWTAIPYRAWRRMVKIPLIICAIAAIFTVYKFAWWVMIFVPIVIFVIYDAQRSAKAMGYIYTQEYMAYRSGWLTKKISLVRLEKTQAVSLRQNPFDKRRNMARFMLDTAGFSMADHNIDIPYLEFQDADFLQKSISAQINTLEFEW